MKLTEEKVRSCVIPTNEILVDLDITQHEVKQYAEERAVFMKDPTNNRLEIMKRESWIREREEFIDNLQQILAWRKENVKKEQKIVIKE